MTEPANAAPTPADLEAHRRYLLKFAMLQVRDHDAAEDLVQETLVAALGAAEGFAGKSSLRTWLTGILLHKIVDFRRKAGRRATISIDSMMEEGGTEQVDALFKNNGSYVELPRDWGDPEQALSQRRFLETLEICVRELPENAAQVFLLREMMGLSTEEVCSELAISATNCSVLLYRARMRLRECMEMRWLSA